MTNNIPSVDPANLETLTGAFHHIFSKLLQRVDGIMPAVVVSFDRSSNPPRAQVQPAIHIRTTDGSQVPRAQIASVPVCRIGAGGAFLDFNLKRGDMGLLFACDRDISLFLQNKPASTPTTYRVKSFSDGFFLPLMLNNAIIDSENSEYPVFQTSDGSICIALQTDKVKIKGNLTLQGNLEVDGDMILKGKLTTSGDVYVSGNISAGGSITPNVPP